MHTGTQIQKGLNKADQADNTIRKLISTKYARSLTCYQRDMVLQANEYPSTLPRPIKHWDMIIRLDKDLWANEMHSNGEMHGFGSHAG
jgi:hypothetical protein